MMRKPQQYRTSDCKCEFIDFGVDRKLSCGQPIDVDLWNEADAESIAKWSSMLRNAMVVLAIVLVLGSSGLSSSAFARGGDGGGGGDRFRGNHFGGGFGGAPGGGYSGYGNRAGGSHSGFRGSGGRDVWGHWGSYYGPIIPNIF